MSSRTWTARERLQRLVELFGPGAGLAKLIDEAPGGIQLATWLQDDDAKAAMVVEHLLGADKLHLRWSFAPFWQDKTLDDKWPFVGAPPPSRLAPGDAGAATPGGNGPRAGPISWPSQTRQSKSPQVGAAPSQFGPGAQPPVIAGVATGPVGAAFGTGAPSAFAPPTPLQAMWSELNKRGKGTAWLPWYRTYFTGVLGAAPLLFGVFRQEEIAHAGTMPLLAEGGVIANAFAAALAIGIAALESVDFNTVHAAPTKGYPSQWTSPNPPKSSWVSPLHKDNRFWDEFDLPPADQPNRFINFGLSTVEASRVWARRVAINLWCDVHQMWPSRLADLTLQHKRLLLGWDPLDPDAADPKLCWRFGAADTSGRGYSAMRPDTPAGAVRFGSDLRPLFWTDGEGPVQSKSHPDGGPCVVPYSLWSMNPYLAWKVAWTEVRPLSMSGHHPAALVTHWLRRRGFGHRSGLLSRADTTGGSKKYFVKPVQPLPTAGRRMYIALMSEFAYDSWDKALNPASGLFWQARSDSTGRTAEVLDANFGGCHMSAALMQEILRAMGVPATLSDCSFPGRSTEGAKVETTSGIATGGLEARGINCDALTKARAGMHGHASLVVWSGNSAHATFHNDTVLSWVGWRFSSPEIPWLPLAEWILLTATVPFDEAPEKLPAWSASLWAAHETAITKSAIHGMAKNLQSVTSLDAAHDQAMVAQVGKADIPPFATERAAWLRSLQRSILAARGAGVQDALYTPLAQTNATLMRNLLLDRESEIADSSVTRDKNLSLAKLMAFITGGPSGIDALVANPPTDPVRTILRDAAALLLGCDTAVLSKLGPSAQAIPWWVDQASPWQRGDLNARNHCCDNYRWGQLPVNWYDELAPGGPRWLVDDPEILISFASVMILAATMKTGGLP